MTEFGDIGKFVRLGAAWFPGGQGGADHEGQFVIRFSDPSEFGSWQGDGEVERSWWSGKGKGWIFLESRVVDEVVTVSRRGSYRGLRVIQFGPVKNGEMAVSPEDNHPRAGEALGFQGHPRFERTAVIPVEEFVDVQEEVTVLYRRGEGWIRG